MADFVTKLKQDLVEQFRGKANIEALMEVVGIELQEVFDFYEQLRTQRSVDTATPSRSRSSTMTPTGSI